MQTRIGTPIGALQSVGARLVNRILTGDGNGETDGGDFGRLGAAVAGLLAMAGRRARRPTIRARNSRSPPPAWPSPMPPRRRAMNPNRFPARPASCRKCPSGFAVSIFAEHLSNARWMAVAPNGDVLLAEPTRRRRQDHLAARHQWRRQGGQELIPSCRPRRAWSIPMAWPSMTAISMSATCAASGALPISDGQTVGRGAGKGHHQGGGPAPQGRSRHPRHRLRAGRCALSGAGQPRQCLGLQAGRAGLQGQCRWQHERVRRRHPQSGGHRLRAGHQHAVCLGQ